jgi:hypothetical protein
VAGRRLLRLDAAYCAVAGAIALLLASPLASLLHVGAYLLAVAGLGAIVWAAVLLRLAARAEWPRAVALVAAANLGAAAGIAALAALTPELAGRLLLAAVAVEVAAFGAAQVAAIRR